MNRPRCFVIVSLIICIIFFSMGFISAKNSGVSLADLFKAADTNIRKADIGPGLTEYNRVDEHFSQKIEGINNIAFSSTFTSVNIVRSQAPNMEINMTGTIKNEISDNLLNLTREGDTLKADIASQRVSNPTSTGLSANITIPESYTGSIEITTDSGEVKFDSSSKNRVSVKTVSGDINYDGGRENTISLKTDSGNIYVFTIGLKADISSTTGTLDILTTHAEGNIRSGSGYVHIRSSEMTSGINIFTDSGEVEFSSSKGYKYEVYTRNGSIKFRDEARFSPLKGEFMKGPFTLRISSITGSIYLE